MATKLVRTFPVQAGVSLDVWVRGTNPPIPVVLRNVAVDPTSAEVT